MPEVTPDHVPSPRTLLAWDGAAYRPVAIDALGRLNVNVLTNLGLDDALQSVATDRLIVRGEDQLFSFKAVLGKSKAGAISGADGYLDSDPVPDGEIWIVSHVFAVDLTSPSTKHTHIFRHDGVDIYYHAEVRAFGAGDSSDQFCKVLMDKDDVIRVYFAGGLGLDDCRVRLVGYTMTKET